MNDTLQRFLRELQAGHERITQADQMIAQRPQRAVGLAERHLARCERERLAQVHQRYPELMARQREVPQALNAAIELMKERLSRAKERCNHLRAAVKRLADGQHRAETIPSNDSVH